MTASKGGGQLGRCVTESTRRYASTKRMANALTTSGNTVYLRPAVPAPRLMAQKLLRRTASPAGNLRGSSGAYAGWRPLCSSEKRQDGGLANRTLRVQARYCHLERPAQRRFFFGMRASSTQVNLG